MPPDSRGDVPSAGRPKRDLSRRPHASLGSRFATSFRSVQPCRPQALVPTSASIAASVARAYSRSSRPSVVTTMWVCDGNQSGGVHAREAEQSLGGYDRQAALCESADPRRRIGGKRDPGYCRAQLPTALRDGCSCPTFRHSAGTLRTITT